MNVGTKSSLVRSLTVLFGISAAACSGASRLVVPVLHPDIDVRRIERTRYAGVAVDVARFEHVSEGLDAHHIGSARTGVSNRVASVRMSEEPAELIQRTIAFALAEAGLDVSGAEPVDYRLSGRIEKFWVEERQHEKVFETTLALVRFTAWLTGRDGARAWSGKFVAEAESHPSLDATEDQQYMLEQAVGEAVQALIDDRDLWRTLAGDAITP